jgi:hypothetical protein
MRVIPLTRLVKPYLEAAGAGSPVAVPRSGRSGSPSPARRSRPAGRAASRAACACGASLRSPQRTSCRFSAPAACTYLDIFGRRVLKTYTMSNPALTGGPIWPAMRGRTRRRCSAPASVTPQHRLLAACRSRGAFVRATEFAAASPRPGDTTAPEPVAGPGRRLPCGSRAPRGRLRAVPPPVTRARNRRFAKEDGQPAELPVDPV